jgi:hypothetical protein
MKIMGNGVFQISVRAVRGGEEVIARKRSRRGTKYITGSIVVLREGKTKEQMRAAIAAAAKTLYGD